MAAFWRSPRLNVDGRSSARSVSPSEPEQVGGVRLPLVGPVQAGDVLEVLPHAEVVVEDRLIAQVRRVGPGVERPDVVAEHGDRAVRRLEQPGRHPQQRRLAAAVVAEQHDPLAGRDGEVDWAERGCVAVALGQALRGECGRHVVAPDVLRPPSSKSRHFLRHSSRRRTHHTVPPTTSPDDDDHP